MDSVSRFLSENATWLHFASGLAAFAMAVVVAMELRHAVKHRYEGALWFLAAFALLQSVQEWLAMVYHSGVERGVTFGPWMRVAGLVLLAAGALCALEFGLRSVRVRAPQAHRSRWDWTRWLPWALVAVWLAGAVALRGAATGDTDSWLEASDVLGHYVLGLPGGILAALAFSVQRRDMAPELRRRYGHYLSYAAWSLIWFTIFDQVLPPPSILWPSTVLNSRAFLDLVGMPVDVFRALAMVAATLTVYRALHVEELETRRAMSDAQALALRTEERRRAEAEEHSGELIRLTRELSALLETTRVVASRLELEPLAKEAISRIVEMFHGVECGCILLRDPATGELETIALTGVEAVCPAARMLADDVTKSGRPALSPSDSLPSVMCVPLTSEAQVLGCMCLTNRTQAGRFTERELAQAQALANPVAVGIERARLYREVQRREQLRRRLLERVVAVQEEERRRIARELHDETGQVLAALVTGLSASTRLCETDPERLPAHLQRLSDVGVQAMEEIERLIADLRPTLLDDLGLVPALRWLIQSHKDELPPVSMDLSLGKSRLPSHIEVELFRITQESLKNIIRHAEATQVSVVLATDSDRVRLTVEDNGVGFDPLAAMDPASPRPAWGLLGMRERAEGLGGTMTIDSRPGAGSRLRFEIPLSEVR